MNVIDMYVKAIAKKYGLEESDIFVSQVESFVFHPEEMDAVIQNPIILEAQNLVTTFLIKSASSERFIHVISVRDT